MSVGAQPYEDREKWFEATKNDVSVVKMVLSPIAELFTPRFDNNHSFRFIDGYDCPFNLK